MDDYLKRFRGRIDRRHIAPATIAVVGVGRVGGQVALELARLVPRRLILVDGDDYEPENVGGHPLPVEYVGWNKSVALSNHLQQEVPGIKNVTAIPHFVDAETSDEQLLSNIIEPASVVVVATDDVEVQRHIAELARAAEVPAVVPGIAADGSRGEAFLSLTEDEPCLECFDGYRPAGSPVRAAALVAPDGYPAVHLAFSLTLAVLNTDSREAEELLAPLRDGGPVPQLFRAWPPGAAELAHADDGRTEVFWREDCPGCGGRGMPVTSPRRRRGGRPRQALEHPDVLSPRTVRRLLVGLIYGLELALLIAIGVSAGLVAATMWASLSFGFGAWTGNEVARRTG